MSTDQKAGSISKSVQKHAGRAKERICILPLHKHRNLMEDCAVLLNSEWKRSLAARIHVLEKSCDQLMPSSFVLVDYPKDELQKPKVIGHMLLAKVVEDPEGCLVSSVLVDRGYRGRGYGKLLMVEVEDIAKACGLRTIYLCTHDKMEFYKHLGYAFSGDVGVTPNIFPGRRLTSFVSQSEQPNSNTTSADSVQLVRQMPIATLPLIPPPPPLPVSSIRNDVKDSAFTRKQIWMKKVLF